ncbi:MAG: twin-arginine translocase subunit TatC [Planctomycetota bacterium]|nr:twin-arginine translocase subunit TatC [Planctomycetota bacterium]
MERDEDEIEVVDSPYPLNAIGGGGHESPDGVFHDAGSHLDELRRRLVVSLAVFAPLFVVGMALYRSLWDIIILPLERAAPHLLRFQALGPSDGLVMAMRISFAFALFLSLPVWLGQIWSFVSPGLTAREKRWLHLSLGSGTVLFILGAALAYFVGVPLALEFLLPFNQTLTGWENAFTGPGYVDFIITCCAGFGLAFELPLVMLALGWAGILTTGALRQWWRPIMLLIVVAAAIMTPPDPFTQCMLAVPMAGLFGVGWILVGWAQPKHK